MSVQLALIKALTRPLSGGALEVCGVQGVDLDLIREATGLSSRETDIAAQG
ncbi:hypothetical protein [Alicyclobacillus fructus]|uniref:hypothetical protein n=1 Tax=Alicyclobacillus fructus TaxID=2816082 RepID=UPI001A8E470C|nr:hypothetical protein [Alicyclobacillus fructus]